MALSAFKIGSRRLEPEDIFFTIEEGQANLGDFSKAISMIDAAATTGADAIEFQLARAGDLYVRGDPGYQRYLKREFTRPQISDLIAHTKAKGMEFIAVPLSHRLVDPLAKDGCAAFNINASDLANPDIIDAVIDSGLSFSLSLAMATQEEVDWAVDRIRKRGIVNYALLNGQHVMAGAKEDLTIERTSLGYISKLKEGYRVPVGFVDHTPFSWMPAAAVAAGADIVSKHMVLSRNDKGPDWHIALEPDCMRDAVSWAKKMRKSMTASSKRLAPGENIDKNLMRKSIVAARRLRVGEVIRREDILFKRPGSGLSASRFSEIVGRPVLREIGIDEQINLSDVEG